MEPKNLSGLYQVNPEYWDELFYLQLELLKMQMWVHDQRKRVAIIFEGRDAAGKGGAIYRFTQNLNPRHYRIVALGKPSDVERGQWYFQRYIDELPNAGEIVFFDRSWYNRAVVEPVMDFCTPEQYSLFIRQVPLVEQMLIEDGIILVKLWFSIQKEVQKDRLDDRLANPLKRWKLSPVDEVALQKWDAFTQYKEQMYNKTHRDYSPWVIINGNNKEKARLSAMRYVLHRIDYEGKAVGFVPPSPDWVKHYGEEE